MGPQDKETGGFGVKLGKNFLDREEIPQAFRHFFIVTGHKPVVHPITRQGVTRSSLTLGDFVFMVGELKVGSAAVNVKRLA